MYKSLIGLWFLVFTPLFFLLYPSHFNPIVNFNEHVEGTRYIEIYKGTFHLIESRLKRKPLAYWKNEVETISKNFGFDIELVDIGLDEYTNGSEIQFFNSEPEYLVKRVKESQWAVKVYVDFSASEKIRRGAMGTVYLLQREFRDAEMKMWPKLIDELSKDFPYNMRLEEIESINMSNNEKKEMLKYSFFWRENDNEIVFYISIGDSSYLLACDVVPLSSVEPSVVLFLIFIFVLIISACLFFWVYPLWRDLESLAVATSGFGKGDFTVRASVSKISIVTRLSEAFNGMAERTEQLVKRQHTLTNAIAHDLRTPIYRLKFAIEILKKSISYDENKKYFDSISSSIEDLDGLIDQTLALSKYSSDKKDKSFAYHDLIKLTKDECKKVFQLYENINYDLIFKIEDGKERAFFDDVAIRRALSNILVNACKFSKSFVLVEVFYDKVLSEYIIDVSDDGVGIAEDDVERVFLPFEQLDNNRQDVSSGHGCGLTIVRCIAQWHSGEVKAGPSKIGGAKISFRWPI
ncbi:ATP-binding protein [Bowmanella denitrificans]|uniref:ATP-binding protein n=1 Tax=Bowmanella denitrificans TaxID=366582 RepID=UPI000C9D0B9B|nr:ATP-binding protein [Bowmanella denitrificans]